MISLTSLASRFANTIGGREPASPPMAAQIEGQIAISRRDLDALVAEHATAAFETVAGVAGADQREQALGEQITSLRRVIEGLTAALAIARQRDAEAARQRWLAEHADLVKRVRGMLQRRHKYAAEFEAAIAQAVQAWRRMVDNSTRALVAYPYGSQLGGTELRPGDIERLVKAELYRQGGVPFVGGGQAESPYPSFPGGVAPNLALRDMPERITPLAQAIEAANEHALKILQGDTVPVEQPQASAGPSDDGPERN